MNITIELGDYKKINCLTPANIANAIKTGEVILVEIKKILPHVEEVVFNTTTNQFKFNGTAINVQQSMLYINCITYPVPLLDPTWVVAAKKLKLRTQKVGHDLNALLNEVLTQLK